MRLVAFLVAALLVAPAALGEQVRSLVPAKPAPNNERRVALVIGNSAYKTSPLRNPVNDARAMAKALTETGFTVTLVEDGSQAGMRRAIRTFGDELLKGGTGLFYYAGHGMQVKGKNYLIPVNADIEREDEIEDAAVDANFVLSKMDTAKNSVNIMILDACRNNPFQRSFRSGAHGLAQMDAPSGTLISFATAPGSVAADGAGDNGLYTSHLLKAIRTPGLPIEQMFKQVRIGVTKDTGDRQVPWESSSLKGEFFFLMLPPGMQAEEAKRQQQQAIDAAVGSAVRQAEEKAARERAELQGQMQKMIAEMLAKQRAELDAERKARGEAPAPPPVVVAPKPAAGDSQQVELAFWDSIKASRDPADFRAYLERYPQGAFAALARNRIGQATASSRPIEADVSSRPTTIAMEARVAPPATPAPPVAAPAQVASIAPAPGPARPGMPKAGDRWTYRYVDPSRPSDASTLSVEVKGAAGDAILEAATRSDGKTSEWAYGPGTYIIGFDTMTVFAPYLAAFGGLRDGQSWSDIEFQRMGACSNGRAQCRATGKVAGRERVTTPAGAFDALRVEVTLTGSLFGRVASLGSTDFVFWYAEAAKRIVKASARSFNTPRPDMDVELLSYQLN